MVADDEDMQITNMKITNGGTAYWEREIRKVKLSFGKIQMSENVEFDDNYWFPFKSDPLSDAKSYSEGLSEDDDEEDDGISDTWEAEVENEKEEGQFRIDDEIVNESEHGRTEEDEQMTNADGIADDPRNSHDGLNRYEN
ncbi:hypothetical protein L2E82_25888 [Cichorium intybus]|uniref:Uncharacterized protein n=1 Tax=Cichorium intybus TaxID=13427 RepID=A0ACB9E4E8_CICIN|nr:hypothetical protein L2E82_25888 [Cichorium intybus]